MKSQSKPHASAAPTESTTPATQQPTAAALDAPTSTEPPTSAPPQTPLGRIPVVDIRPCVDNGTRPAKSVVDEEFVISARVFREGHDAVNASVVLVDPDGSETVLPMTCVNEGLSVWEAVVSADRTGAWQYRVEGWSDPYGTWRHDAMVKIAAGVDVELMLEEGARVFERALDTVDRTDDQRAILQDAISTLRDSDAGVQVRLDAGAGEPARTEMTTRPLREMLSPSDAYPWLEQARPIWWVIRGAMLAWFLWLLLGANLGVFFIVIGAALSFWVGLRQDGWTGWRGRGVLIANVAAALLLLPGMLAMAENRGYAGANYYESVEVAPSSGAFVDGQPAENFYVYDGQGQRVEGARIFTNTGAPLTSEFSNWWDGDDVLPDARFDAFPVTFGPYDGWQGTTEDAGERFGTQPFTPPVAMPPAFPIETESTETATTTPESTQSPTEPSPTETPTDEPAAEEPTDTPTDATPEPTETATP